jgi:membrane protein
MTMSRHGGRSRTPAPQREPGPPEATQVSAIGWKAAFGSARRHMKGDRVNVAAGAFAYRWFLSLFPTVIALLGVASLMSIPHHLTVRLIHGVTQALPPGAAGVLTGAINAASHRTAGALSAVVVATAVALWSATSGMVMVEEGLDMAYEVGRDRSFLGKRVLAVPLLVGSAVLGGAASALVVFGPQIGRAIQGSAPIGGSTFSAGWTAVRWIAALILINLLFGFLYWLAPNQHTRWRWLSPGSLVGTALWAVISLAFSFYTTSLGSYGKTYGAFAGVAILIFWLYLTGLAILVGGEVNAAFERGRPAPSG